MARDIAAVRMHALHGGLRTAQPGVRAQIIEAVDAIKYDDDEHSDDETPTTRAKPPRPPPPKKKAIVVDEGAPPCSCGRVTVAEADAARAAAARQALAAEAAEAGGACRVVAPAESKEWTTLRDGFLVKTRWVGLHKSAKLRLFVLKQVRAWQRCTHDAGRSRAAAGG